MKRPLLRIGLACALLSACGAADPQVVAKSKIVSPPTSQPAPPSQPARSPQRATLRIDVVALPARYAAPLPSSSLSLQRWLRGSDTTLAPASHVIDNLMFGDARWFARFVESAAKVPADDGDAWARTWAAALQFAITTPQLCAPAKPIMTGPAGPARVAIAETYARACPGPQLRDLMLRKDTPEWAVISYFDPWDEDGVEVQPPPAYDPRLAEAVRWMVREEIAQKRRKPVGATPEGGSFPVEMAYRARPAAITLADLHDPRAEAALFEIHAGIDDADTARDVAMAFHASKDPRGRKIFADACRAAPDDPMCGPAVSALYVEERSKTPPDLTAIERRLAQLAQLGFTRTRELDPRDLEDDSAMAALVKARHAYGFDVETDRWPNRHDSLMRQLARLATPALDDAIFEESPPRPGVQATYRLVAYDGGKRFSCDAQDLGDWYDVETVLHLMNAVLAEHKSALQFVPLDTDDQWLIVVAATPQTVAAATRAQVFKVGTATAAEAVGKEAERKVRENGEDEVD